MAVTPEPNFDVSTPLRQNESCHSPAEVKAEIERYMKSDSNTDIGNVSVIEFSTHNNVAAGRDRDPNDFWP
ncbi:MAG TPA: hypothetical protein VIL92_12720 [Gaiellaceae bacterium]